MAMSLPSQAARDALLCQHKINLRSDPKAIGREPDRSELWNLESLYLKLSSLWGQAIARSPEYLPRLKRRPPVVVEIAA